MRRGVVSVVSSPSGVRGSEPRPKRTLAYFEGHRTLLFVPICWCFEQSGAWNFETWQNLKETIWISSLHSKFWGGLAPPRPPWSTPMPVYRPAREIHSTSLLLLIRILPVVAFKLYSGGLQCTSFANLRTYTFLSRYKSEKSSAIAKMASQCCTSPIFAF